MPGTPLLPLPRDPLSFLFLAVYVLSFREPTKTAASWEAFRWPTIRQLVLKSLISGFLLILVPSVSLLLFAKLINCIEFPALTFSSVVWRATPILLVGLFPRATKNIWALVATKQFQSRNKKANGERWVDEKMFSDVPDRPIPQQLYSWKVVFWLGLIPPLWLWWIAAHGCSIPFGWKALPALWRMFGLKDLPYLCATLYSAQMVVLFHTAKERKLVYPNKRPKNLFNWRLTATFGFDIFAPVVFGIFWYACLLALPQGDRFDHIVITIAIVLCTGFPYFSSGVFSLFVKWRWREVYDNARIGVLWSLSAMSLLSILIIVLVLGANRDYLPNALHRAKQMVPNLSSSE